MGDKPLESLGGLKDTMGPLAKKVNEGVQRLTDFVGQAPDKIKGAFQVPTPLCCMTSCAMSQAPPVMKDLLTKVDTLQGFDFKPIMDMLEGMQENLGNLDTS